MAEEGGLPVAGTLQDTGRKVTAHEERCVDGLVLCAVYRAIRTPSPLDM